jgi:hypothetical protein
MEQADSWKPLTRIGCVAIGLGALYLVRYFHPYPTLVFDFPSMIASFAAGWALLRRLKTALVTTAVAAGVILADALVSLITMGPLLLRAFHHADNGDEGAQVFAMVAPIVLVYAFEAVFWPYAAAVVMRDLRRKGIPDAYADHTRATVIGSFFIPGWISLVLHLWVKVLAFNLV